MAGISMGRTIGKALLIVVCVVLVLAGGLVAWLTLTEYRPAPVEALEVERGADPGRELAPGMELTLATFNIGYGGLGAESDFFMDGGSQVQPLSQALVEKNLAGITALLEEADADIYLLQEVDADAKRSYGIDQRAVLSQGKGMDTAYALNYSCDFVPFPWPPIGRVHSGLYTMSSVSLAEGTGASRYALPCPFAWPVRTANLKRCLLATRIPLTGTEQELVVVNLHLEAYDDGAGKAQQTAMLMDLLQEEYAAGNYVIAGGDFNCSFPVVDPEAWPILSTDNYVPGVIDGAALPAGFQWAVDASLPTCRLLNHPLGAGEQDQFYVIDGFILSPNVTLLGVETLAGEFQYSDHNPVRLTVALAD